MSATLSLSNLCHCQTQTCANNFIKSPSPAVVFFQAGCIASLSLKRPQQLEFHITNTESSWKGNKSPSGIYTSI